MSKTTTAPAPFRALDPIIRPPAVKAAKPRVIDADNAHERRHAGLDRWADLPAEGPREVHVKVIGGAFRLVPTDRAAARDLLTARAGLGRTYDRRREAYLFPFDDMARHGAANLAGFRLACEMGGVRLVIDEAATRAIEGYRRNLERQLRPIPRTVWADDAAHGDRDGDVTVVDFHRQRR